jgi:uncharacterized protein YjbI with pentapeptide repeats
MSQATSIKPIPPPQLPPNLSPLPLPHGSFVDDEEYADGRLSSAILVGQQAANFHLERIMFRATTLQQTRFLAPRLRDLRFDECDLANAEWERADGLRIEWRDCRLTGFTAAESHWQDVIWRRCNLSLARFRFGDFRNLCFDHCDLSEADFHGAALTNVRFIRCNLTNVEFSHVRLADIDLRTSTIEGIMAGPQELTGAIVTFVQAAYLAGRLGLVIKEAGKE